MEKVRIASIGGFYGVGKTTTIMEIGKKLSGEGKRVAVVSNDRGAINVDGEMTKSLGFEVEEITGGCVCFYLDHLRYIIDTITDRFVPDLLFLEPVAYFLPSKLYDDLERKFGEALDLAPVVILVDAPRLSSYQGHTEKLPFPESRQIEDAEVVVINKIDLVSPDSLPAIRTIVQHINPRARLIMMSAKMGSGLDELSNIVLQGRHESIPLATMTVFKTFARSVTEIGERGERYAIEVEPFIPEIFDIGFDAISVKQSVDIARIKPLVGDVKILGNVESKVVMTHGTVEEVRAVARKALEGGVTMLEPSCGLEALMPLDNIKVLVEEARNN